MIKLNFLIMTVSLILLSACGNDKNDQSVKTVIANAEVQAMKKQVKTIEDIELPKPVFYQSKKSVSRVPKRQDNGSIVPVNPLTAYPLREYKFVGVIVKDNQISAYLLSPDGTLYVANAGDEIGSELSKVVSIMPSELKISQTEYDEKNQPIEKTSSIYLKGEQNE